MTAESPSVLVILNPASSGGRAGRLRRTVEEILSRREVGYEIRVTRGPGHAEELAREAVELRRDMILAVGGDGTVHEIAQGLLTPGSPGAEEGRAEDGPTLAVVPVGTGNDFFRMVGPSRDPETAVAVALEGESVRFDVGRARWEGGERYFVNLLGIGVDVEVLRRRRAFGRLPGLAQYLAALLVAVLRFRPYPIRIRLDDQEEIQGRTHLSAVTVGPSAGGGFLLNPGATPDDGFLDLCFVEALTYPQIARYIPRIIRGTHANLDVIELRRFRRGRMEHPQGRPFHFQLDGELMPQPVKWIDFEVVPGLLPVRVPGSVRDLVHPGSESFPRDAR